MRATPASAVATSWRVATMPSAVRTRAYAGSVSAASRPTLSPRSYFAVNLAAPRMSSASGRSMTASPGPSAGCGALVDNSYKWAGGGFLSTAQDLVRFGSSLLQPGFLKAESLALLFTPQKTSSGQETTYGIGWDISRSKSGKRIYAHSGGSVGGTTWLIVYPDKRVVVAFVCNFDREGGGFVTREDIEKVGEAFERGAGG